ncbi:pectate lyase [Evansella sp. AB-rgal1]|uniref:pectate lyase n=1 Tax=Evansella sp. AB-rgal1 TaxID=3242696 RepID=UPI00359DB57D
MRLAKRLGNCTLIFMIMFMSVFSSIPISFVKAADVSDENVFTFEANFNDDITGDVPGNVTVNEAGGTVRVVEVPDEANKSVFLEDTSDVTHVALYKSVEDLVGEVTVEMKIMQPSYTSSTKVMRLKGNGTAVTLETNGGNISYRTGSNFQPLVPLVENKWYHIKVVMDIDAQTADVHIDGELKLEGAAFDQPLTKFNFFETFTPNSGTKGHYVDDLKISGLLPVEDDTPTDPTDPTEPSEPVEDGKDGIYEAEYAEFEAAIIDNKHVGFTGIGFVDYVPNAPGGWIEWTVDVPVAGEYNLDFRYAHGGTDLRPKEIVVNGEVVNGSLAFDPSGGWATWVYTSMKATLHAGENTVRAIGIAPSGGANVDHLRVYLEFDEILEAEDALFEAAIIDNKHVGFTGTGFVDYVPNAPGGWIEWTVDIPVAGSYKLDFRYAHGGTDLRPKEILVNGEIVTPELAFDPTGGWTVWQYSSLQAELVEGENVIRAVGIAPSGGANVDHLRVHNKADSSSEGPMDIEEVEITDIVSGLLLNDLNELGMLVDSEDSDKANQPITRLEFMALINDTFGFVKTEKFKNLNLSTNVWEVTVDEWYAYVLEAAHQAGYMASLEENGNIYPTQEMTKQEADQVFAALQGDTSNSSNTELLTWSEALELVGSLSVTPQENVKVVGVQAISNNLLVVTLNSYFEEFDFSDVDVVSPTRNWALLSPGFKNLRVDKGALGINKFGQSVLVLHSLDEWDEYAELEFEQEEVRFSGDLANAITEANNLLTWQMDHGGWTKNWPHIYTREWNGTEPRSEWVHNGRELGTIDNDATISEIIFLAQIYNETKDERYKESIEKGFEFLFNLQYDTGGFAQVYPARGNYSDYVTFNDEAMINVLEMLDDVLERRYPFNSDVISNDYYSFIEESMELAVDYIVKAQIEVDGKLNVWSAQHDPVTYEPRGARSYEHASNSGSESIGIIRFLMSRPQTEEVKRSILGALEWLDEVKLENTRYVSGDPNNVYFYDDPNSTAWYRFYEIGTDRGIFSGRDGVIKYDILEIEEERRNGYAWGGHWGTQLLDVSQKIGFFDNKVFVRVVDTNSEDVLGRTLIQDDIERAKGETKELEKKEYEITVAQDGSGDYETVQAAIDAVPENNTKPVTIHIKNGTYYEVVTVPANKPFITMIGESETDTVITYDNYAGKDNGVGGTIGTSGSASVFLRANDFRAENITFENSFDESLDVNGKQAVAVYASGDRMYFKNVKFIGNQDTLYTHSGSQYFYQVYVEGDVDFIFGGARAVFEDSIIHSLDRGSSTNNGYITAASTLLSEEFGMLILNSKLTSDAPAGTVYLGRPWPAGGNPEARGSVVFMHSELGEHIHVSGWTSMSGLDPADARLFEYENYGPGAVVNDARRQLTDEEAAQWTVANVLKGWNPNGDSPGNPNPNPGDGDSPDPGDGDDESPNPEVPDKVYEETVLVFEDFESIAVGSQPDGFTFTGDVSEVVELDGVGKVLHLPASGNSNGFTLEFDPQTGIVSAELDFMQPVRANATVVLVLADDSGNDVIRIEARDHLFSTRLPDNTFKHSTVQNINEKWTNVKVIADVTTQTFNLIIDGEIAFENEGFYRNGENIAQIKSITPGSSVRDHYVDNIKVSELVEVTDSDDNDDSKEKKEKKEKKVKKDKKDKVEKKEKKEKDSDR